jgi:hypothetical protein
MSELAKVGINQSSLGDIDLSDFDRLIEEAKQSQTSLALSEEHGRTQADPLWKAHVTAYLGKSDRITWVYPTTKEERIAAEKSGEGIYEEVSPSAAEHHFVGVRGIVLKVSYGRKLNRPKPGTANEFETICHTTALVNEMTGQTVTERLPMEIPLSQIHHNKDNPHNLTPWLESRPYLKLYGSRPPVGTEEGVKTNKTRTCAECVAAGEHYIGSLEEFIDSSKSTPKCSLDGNMLFCVFQLGLLDSSQVLKGGKSQVKWIDVRDAQLTVKRPDGTMEERTTPFIIKIAGLSSVQHWELGSGKFKRDIVTTGKNCYLPENAKLHSWGEYFNNYLHAKAGGEIRALDIKGNTVYPVVTDLMMAKLKNDEYQASHLPVYTPVLDPDVISRGEGLSQLDWMKAALQCLQYEQDLVKNGSAQTSPDALPGEAPAVLPSAKKEPVESAPDAPAAAPEAPKSTFAAFTAPPKVG